MLSFLYFPKEVSGNMENELQQREIALKEISKNIDYRIALKTIVTSNGEYAVYENHDGKYEIMSVVSINYKLSTGGSVQEKIVFDKLSGQWKIIKIYSSDRYLPLRTSNYTYWPTLDSLLPKE